jgi:hypothetical protein
LHTLSGGEEEVERKLMGMVAVVLGVIAVLLALLADTLGIGGQEGTFGWKQVALLAVGVALAVGGLLVVLWARGQERGDTPRPSSET